MRCANTVERIGSFQHHRLPQISIYREPSVRACGGSDSDLLLFVQLLR